MAFATSKIFRATVAAAFDGAPAIDLDSDSFLVALFNNSVVPDQDAAAASIAYNTGTWLVANEISQTTTWPAGGRPLVSPVVDKTVAATVFWDAADTASNGNATLSGAYGAFVYDNTTTPKIGISHNAFGGSQSVTNGSFTCVWHANGLWRASL